MKADLHCHTVLSDGAMRVDQIMPYAKRIGLDYIAISDHESTHSIPEAVRLGKELGVHAGSFHCLSLQGSKPQVRGLLLSCRCPHEGADLLQ